MAKNKREILANKISGKLLLEAFLKWKEEEDCAEYIGYSRMTISEVSFIDLKDLCLDGNFNLERIAEIFIEKLNKRIT